jgi:hypothetical protein
MNNARLRNATTMKNKKNTIALINSADLLVSISEKEKEVNEIQVKMENLLAKLKQMKAEEKTLQETYKKEHDLAKIKIIEFGEKWSQLEEIGMTTKEIILIQSVLSGGTLKTISKELDIGAYRVRAMLCSASRNLRQKLCRSKYADTFSDIPEKIEHIVREYI